MSRPISTRASRTLAPLGLTALALASQLALAQSQAPQAPEQAASQATAEPQALERITITGTRIKTLALQATSPVAQVGSDQIQMWRATTVEDFSAKLPQLASGVNGTSAGSDAFGAQTLDLRNLGQSRTLVLINGTRAVPFSLRNAVDVNFIPASLIKRVDLLTGGAAAVYGADAVAGVVNFIMNDTFEGMQAQANYRHVSGGASQTSASLTGGFRLGDRGHVVGYLEVTDREKLLAGERDWALTNPTLLAPAGGNFTDVASGNKFSFTESGQLTTTPQRSNYTPQYLMVMPLKRTNASLFFKHELPGETELYGRAMFSKVETTGAPRSGQVPATVNAVYDVLQSNTNIPADVRSRLTFVNGVAKVNVERSLGELGVMTADNNRYTSQVQLGIRGEFTPAISWDIYTQTGRSAESIVVHGDGVKAALANVIATGNIFGPGANLSSVAQDWKYGDRVRTQNVTAANISGDTSDVFKLPAGAVGFALGLERRREKGEFDYNQALGGSFSQGVETPPATPPKMNADEAYVEVSVPLLKNLPLMKALSLEAAYRRSSYEKSVGADNDYGTNKWGGSWLVNDSVRVRATRQSVIREPNFGEFASPVFSIPFANLVTVARLQPRYQGDPCVLGTGNAEQCKRFGAPAVGSYDSLAAGNLTGGYFFGGNPEIRAEKGKTTTFGVVFTPAFLPGASLTLDYYKIRLKDAVGQIQPVDALTSCYITDPRADNPLCAAVTRDPATGRIKDGFPVDRNLAMISQSGIDIDASYRQRSAFGLAGHNLTWGYQASIVRSYSIQKNPILDPIDCKGTYGVRCSSDAVSLVAPSYRHRASIGWTHGDYSAQFGWKRIGAVKDSTVGSDGRISAQDTFDLNASVQGPIKGMTFNVGIDNLFDKNPPMAKNPATFNTYPDTYSVLGRSIGVSVTMRH